MKINCLIIDDEPSSQMVLKKFIADVEFLELMGVCNNAIDAIHELKQNQTIDLLFLDINMPKISGLTFYKSLQNPPEVIFTTAYPQYGQKARKNSCTVIGSGESNCSVDDDVCAP
jgi:DNA-binding LytR/AlgR family response regulator